MHFQSINEQLDSLNVPFELVEGFIGGMEMEVPLMNLSVDNTIVRVRNFELTVQAKQRKDVGMNNISCLYFLPNDWNESGSSLVFRCCRRYV